MKELEEYKSFVYFYEGMIVDKDVLNQPAKQQQVSMTTESHIMNFDVHSETEMNLDAELQNEVEVYFDSDISVHERDFELLEKHVHSDSKIDRPNEET